MSFIVVLVVLVLVAMLIVLFMRDAQRAQHGGASSSDSPLPQADPVPRHPAPKQAGPPEPAAVDTEELAAHVRELRRALDEGLLLRHEAVASIVRQSGGGIGDEAAERLLDSASPSDEGGSWSADRDGVEAPEPGGDDD